MSRNDEYRVSEGFAVIIEGGVPKLSCATGRDNEKRLVICVQDHSHTARIRSRFDQVKGQGVQK